MSREPGLSGRWFTIRQQGDHPAVIAFYVVTSLAPILLIVVAIAGIVFGEDAVRGSLVKELGGLFGQQRGEFIQTMLARSSDKASGATASLVGIAAVLITASGVFSEMQAGLNKVWDVEARDLPWLSMMRARAASLGLVAALGFLLMVSLAASALLSALSSYLGEKSAFAPLLLALLNTVVSLGLFPRPSLVRSRRKVGNSISAISKEVNLQRLDQIST